jgi:hypothetical protein
VPQFIDSDDNWRKCLLIEEKLQDDSEEIKDGINCANSAAPSKLEATSIVVGANDEARSPFSPSTVASTAPSIRESTSDALRANKAEKYNIHPYTHSSELPQAKASLINATTTATPQPTTTTTQLNDKNDNRDRCVDDITCARQRNDV